jgi:hypothetical protein
MQDNRHRISMALTIDPARAHDETIAGLILANPMHHVCARRVDAYSDQYRS